MSEHRCFRKKETKYLYNAFQARDRRDESECDSAVEYIGLPFGLFRLFLNTKNAPKYQKKFIWLSIWNMISPVIFAGAMTIFAGALPPWAPPW